MARPWQRYRSELLTPLELGDTASQSWTNSRKIRDCGGSLAAQRVPSPSTQVILGISMLKKCRRIILPADRSIRNLYLVCVHFRTILMLKNPQIFYILLHFRFLAKGFSLTVSANRLKPRYGSLFDPFLGRGSRWKASKKTKMKPQTKNPRFFQH